MPLSLIIPFAIALMAAWIAYGSREEIVKTFFVIVCHGNQFTRELRLGTLAGANSDSSSEFRGNALFLLPSFLSEYLKAALSQEPDH